MTVLGFGILFHTAFRVGAASGRDGVLLAVDLDDPLPADHLKGLMRAAARDVLHLDPQRIDAVFGASGRARACAWSWSSALPDTPSDDAVPGAAASTATTGTGWRFATRHRVALDPATHSARKDQLVVAEQVWAPQARFTVSQWEPLPEDEIAEHSLILRAAGAAVHGLGGWRRRGLGWVGVRPDDPLTDADLTRLVALRAAPTHRPAPDTHRAPTLEGPAR